MSIITKIKINGQVHDLAPSDTPVINQYFTDGVNIFDKESLIADNAWKSAEAAMSPKAGYSCTPMIPWDASRGITVRTNYKCYRIALYDADKNIIGAMSSVYAYGVRPANQDRTIAYVTFTFHDSVVDYDNLMVIYTNETGGGNLDFLAGVPYIPYTKTLNEDQVTLKNKNGINAEDFLLLATLGTPASRTIAKNEATGITEVTFNATGSSTFHVEHSIKCDPLKVVLVEFYGKTTHAAYDGKTTPTTNGMVIVTFHDADGAQIGSKYNGYVLGRSRCGYHRYGFVAPMGTVSATMSIVTRAETSITLHSFSLKVVDQVPTRERNGVLFDAHLGLLLAAPENTLPAFELAKKAGFTHCITNCNWNADKELYALHDDRIDETSDGEGNIHDLPADVLSRYDFGSWFDKAYTGTGIPKLEDVVKLMAQTGIVPIFRLHNHWRTSAQVSGSTIDPAQAKTFLERIYSWICHYGFKGKAGVKAFATTILADCYEIMGDAVEYIYCGNPDAAFFEFYETFKGKLTVEPGFAWALAAENREQIERAVAAGIPVSSYTVNDPAAMRDLINLGVTRFCTDTFSDIVFPID